MEHSAKCISSQCERTMPIGCMPGYFAASISSQKEVWKLFGDIYVLLVLRGIINKCSLKFKRQRAIYHSFLGRKKIYPHTKKRTFLSPGSFLYWRRRNWTLILQRKKCGEMAIITKILEMFCFLTSGAMWRKGDLEF